MGDYVAVEKGKKTRNFCRILCLVSSRKPKAQQGKTYDRKEEQKGKVIPKSDNLTIMKQQQN
jgi:hypothetical protein